MNRSLHKAYEITNAKISFVSLVDKAANKRKFLMKKADDGKAAFTTYGRIVKADAESHFVTGIVYEPMEEDSHGNYMTEEEILKAAYWFAKNGNMVDLQHSFEPLEKAQVVESWVAKADFELDGETIKKGTWLMTVEISDEEVWQGIEKGEITGFSMGGIGDYSEEDVDLSTVSKTDEKDGKKGLLKQLADALGFGVVEKGSVAEIYSKRTKGSRFWDAYAALESSLRKYDPVTGLDIYETDEAKIRECLEDFSAIVSDILLGGTPIAKAIVPEGPVKKSGRALSSKNLETLHGIRDSLDTFLKAFEPEEEPDDEKPEEDPAPEKKPEKEGEQPEEDEKKDAEGTKKSVTKEDTDMTKQEVEAIVAEAIQKAAKPEEQPKQEPVEKAVTPESIQSMVEAAVAKALEPVQKQETVTAEQVEDMIAKAVEKAVEPILKSRGLPTNLNGSEPVEKKAAEEHYLHGIL